MLALSWLGTKVQDNVGVVILFRISLFRTLHCFECSFQFCFDDDNDDDSNGDDDDDEEEEDEDED